MFHYKKVLLSRSSGHVTNTCTICGAKSASHGDHIVHVMMCSSRAAKQTSVFQGLSVERPSTLSSNSTATPSVGRCLVCYKSFESELLLSHLVTCVKRQVQNPPQPLVSDIATTTIQPAASAKCLRCFQSFAPEKLFLHLLACHTSPRSIALRQKEIQEKSEKVHQGLDSTNDDVTSRTESTPRKKRGRGKPSRASPDCVSWNSGTQRYHCTVCNKSFKTKHQVHYHEWCLNPMKPKPFSCCKCDAQFISKSHYSYHMNQHEDVKPHECEDCGKRFTQPAKLKRHINGVHLRIKPFVCNTCNRTFTSAQYLKEHNYAHTGEKPYSCEVCGRKFAGLANAHKHAKIHRKEKDTYTYICDSCGKLFRSKATLVNHQRIHEPSARAYPCQADGCSRSFYYRKDLVRHDVEIHQGLRTFQCPCCNRGFSRKDHLVRHRRTKCKEESPDDDLPFVIVEAYTESM